MYTENKLKRMELFRIKQVAEYAKMRESQEASKRFRAEPYQLKYQREQGVGGAYEQCIKKKA